MQPAPHIFAPPRRSRATPPAAWTTASLLLAAAAASGAAPHAETRPLTHAAQVAAQAAAPAPASQPTTAPAHPDADDDDSSSEIEKIKGLPGVRPMRLADVVALRKLENHCLEIVTSVPATATESRIPLTDDPSIASITVTNQPFGVMHLVKLRTDVPGYTTVRDEVLGQPVVQLIRNTWSRTAGSQSVELFQRPPTFDNDEPDRAVRLTVHCNDAKTFEITAPDIDQLIRRHPSETARYLRPLLRDLGMDATLFAGNVREAWQVLAPDRPPDPGTMEKVNAILPKLDSDDAATREAAQKSLAAIGQPAANALHAMNRNNLTPQQSAEVDAFLSPYSPLTPEEALTFSKNPDRLASYLTLDEPEVRKLAYARLTKVARNVPPFNPDAPADERAKQLEDIETFIVGPVPGATTRAK